MYTIKKMVRPVKRRYSSVAHAKYLLGAVSYIRQQKQVPNLDRITRYMNREHGVGKHETEKQLNYMVKDGLIWSYTAIGKKGSMTGVEQEGFKIPDNFNFEGEDHDWYCFECHSTGEVLPCSDCYRVFHPSCTDEEWTGPKFTCTICKYGRTKNKLKRKLLNTLLSYTILRLKEKTRELHKIGHRDEEKEYEKYFVFKPMDLNQIEHKVESNKYRSLEEFVADTQLIFHNVFLIYGDDVKGGMTELARIMSRDCAYDDPPHTLVYAKQKGYSHWPAKVIREFEGKYDVRFFGGLHQRALLPKEAIKPIETNVKSLTIKRTAACEELQVHQRLLEEKKKNVENGNDKEDEEEMEEGESESSDDRLSEGKSRDESEEDEDERIPDNDNSTLEVSSTSAPTPEDANIVTSSEDKIKVPEKEEKPVVPKVATVTIGLQTLKKPSKTVHVQTDPLPATQCSCDEKYIKLKKDFEEDKHQAVTRAMAKVQKERELAEKQTEEKCKAEYMEEMKKLAAKHKEHISTTKKKQWCFNCEEEAMYHCCWNTSYCSVKCQQEHWHKEHKRVCRRKR
ncbi:hypothetical protein KUTeg_008643 [Tegillarca granosa]|uniref:Zinc finger MYND domain-containing protein 11 n=1 Tax=Tegillarca granosa TaxID=220873 RepID=A0ABQ9FE06_TEGGR|nr:hypothetical protein KUTeg_008643 [Tegillarca granosa]